MHINDVSIHVIVVLCLVLCSFFNNNTVQCDFISNTTKTNQFNNSSCCSSQDIIQKITENHGEDFDYQVQLTDWLNLEVTKNANDTITLKLSPGSNKEQERKMNSSMKKMIPYMVIPGFLMAGIMPWIMPGLKMMVSTVAMVNQMAFTTSLFALVRSYVFDTEKEEHIVYVNHGYRPKAKPHHRRIIRNQR